MWLQGRQLTAAIKAAFEHFTDRAANGFVIPEWLPTPANVAYNGAVETLDGYVYALIASRRAALAAADAAAAAAAPAAAAAAAEAAAAQPGKATAAEAAAAAQQRGAAGPGERVPGGVAPVATSAGCDEAAPGPRGRRGAGAQSGHRDLLTALLRARDDAGGGGMADGPLRYGTHYVFVSLCWFLVVCDDEASGAGLA